LAIWDVNQSQKVPDTFSASSKEGA
jgi:hypothetical protein